MKNKKQIISLCAILVALLVGGAVFFVKGSGALAQLAKVSNTGTLTWTYYENKMAGKDLTVASSVKCGGIKGGESFLQSCNAKDHKTIACPLGFSPEKLSDIWYCSKPGKPTTIKQLTVTKNEFTTHGIESAVSPTPTPVPSPIILEGSCKTDKWECEWTTCQKDGIKKASNCKVTEDCLNVKTSAPTTAICKYNPGEPTPVPTPLPVPVSPEIKEIKPEEKNTPIVEPTPIEKLLESLKNPTPEKTPEKTEGKIPGKLTFKETLEKALEKKTDTTLEKNGDELKTTLETKPETSPVIKETTRESEALPELAKLDNSGTLTWNYFELKMAGKDLTVASSVKCGGIKGGELFKSTCNEKEHALIGCPIGFAPEKLGDLWYCSKAGKPTITKLITIEKNAFTMHSISAKAAPVPETKIAWQLPTSVACRDVSSTIKGSTEIVEFLNLMYKKGNYLPNVRGVCRPSAKIKWSMGVQMALTLADESCGVELSKLSDGNAGKAELRKACMARAIEIGLIEKEMRGNMKKVEFYDLMLKGANLSMVEDLEITACEDVTFDDWHYGIFASAKQHGMLRTYKLNGQRGYCLPKAPMSVSHALRSAKKALEKSPIIH